MCDGIHGWGLRCRSIRISRSCWPSGRSCKREWRTCSGRWPHAPHPHPSGALLLPTRSRLSTPQSDGLQTRQFRWVQPSRPSCGSSALPGDSGNGPETRLSYSLSSCLLGLGPVPSTSGWHFQPVTMCMTRWQPPLSCTLCFANTQFPSCWVSQGGCLSHWPAFLSLGRLGKNIVNGKQRLSSRRPHTISFQGRSVIKTTTVT